GSASVAARRAANRARRRARGVRRAGRPLAGGALVGTGDGGARRHRRRRCGIRGARRDDGGIAGLDRAAAGRRARPVGAARGILDLLGSFPVRRLVYARRARPLVLAARAASVRSVPIAEGSEIDAGALRVEALWPPRTDLGAAARGTDPNLLALVLMARWRDF